MSTNRGMVQWTMLYSYNEILLSKTEEGIIDIHSNMDESPDTWLRERSKSLKSEYPVIAWHSRTRKAIEDLKKKNLGVWADQLV